MRSSQETDKNCFWNQFERLLSTKLPSCARQSSHLVTRPSKYSEHWSEALLGSVPPIQLPRSLHHSRRLVSRTRQYSVSDGKVQGGSRPVHLRENHRKHHRVSLSRWENYSLRGRNCTVIWLTLRIVYFKATVRDSKSSRVLRDLKHFWSQSR